MRAQPATRSRDARLFIAWWAGGRWLNGWSGLTCWFGLVVSCCFWIRLDVRRPGDGLILTRRGTTPVAGALLAVEASMQNCSPVAGTAASRRGGKVGVSRRVGEFALANDNPC